MDKKGNQIMQRWITYHFSCTSQLLAAVVEKQSSIDASTANFYILLIASSIADNCQACCRNSQL